MQRLALLLSATALVGVSVALGRAEGAAPVGARSCSAIQNPDGKLLLVSDLPLRGASRQQSLQMTQAIAAELEAAGWRAGKYTVAYQSCDDSTAASGTWDASTCQANATAYAVDGAVVGVVGPANSGCAEAELPVANRAPNGPLSFVSPANTATGLTHAGPGTAAGEPGRYFPTGRRGYARLLAPDDLQGAADALLARQLGAAKLFVLHDREPYGVGIAGATARAAKKLRLTVAGFGSWDPHASSYSTLAAQVRSSGAQAVLLGGLAGSNAGRLIADLRAGAPGVSLIAPAGFTPVSRIVASAGAAAEGLYVSAAGLPLDKLPRRGQSFAKRLARALGIDVLGTDVDPAAVYAAQAVDVLLAAIAASNGTRAGVAAHLLGVQVPHGLTGNVAFDASGDPVAAPVTIYKIVQGAATPVAVLTPSPSLVSAG